MKSILNSELLRNVVKYIKLTFLHKQSIKSYFSGSSIKRHSTSGEFWLTKTAPKEIKDIVIGEDVDLWFPPTKAFISVYRYSDYGNGWLGGISARGLENIIFRKDRGEIIYAEIVDINRSSCLIKWTVAETLEEIQKKNQQKIHDINEKIRKPYRPIAHLKHKFGTKNSDRYKVGDDLTLDLEKVISELNQGKNLKKTAGYYSINIPINHNGVVVDGISAQLICFRLLRAIKSGYKLKAKITDIDNEFDNYSYILFSVEFLKNKPNEIQNRIE
jgi:hypothetical protein